MPLKPYILILTIILSIVACQLWERWLEYKEVCAEYEEVTAYHQAIGEIAKMVKEKQ